MSTLRGKKATKHDEKLNKAAKSYIDAVDGPAKDTAKAVDKDFADIIAKAQKRVDELFPKDKKHQKHSKEEKKFQEAVVRVPPPIPYLMRRTDGPCRRSTRRARPWRRRGARSRRRFKS